MYFVIRNEAEWVYLCPECFSEDIVYILKDDIYRCEECKIEFRHAILKKVGHE